jgi:porin
MPQPHRGDYGLYAVANQKVWRPSADCQRSLGVFVRIMDAPGGRCLVYLGMHA